jgi:hypothetical protein
MLNAYTQNTQVLDKGMFARGSIFLKAGKIVRRNSPRPDRTSIGQELTLDRPVPNVGERLSNQDQLLA